MPTPQAQELMDSNDRPQCPMQTFQQRNIHNSSMYTECRFTHLDHPPQRTVGDHQLMNLNHQSDTVQNDVYPPPINSSTPFQPHNQNPMLVQQQAQSDSSDIVA